MMRSWLTRALALLALGVAFGAHAATRVYSGEAPSGAWYKFEVPDGWRAGDTLVLYQHGFDLKAPADAPGLGPLRRIMLAEGYAVAATSYRERGWALFTAIEDNRELLQLFADTVGAPGEVIPYGGSMGGLITLQLAGTPGLPPMRGAYALCPAAAGARLWDSAIDLRLAYDVVCRDAGSLPQGDEPLPWAVNLGDIPDDIGDLSNDESVLSALVAVNRCTGANLPPYLRNDAMQRRLDELMAFAHITDEHFFVTNIGYATYVLADIVRAADKLGGRNPFTTAGVDYSSDPAVDAGIERLVADPAAALALHEASDFRGGTGEVKVISMHTSRDQLVVPGNQDFVRDNIDPDKRVIAIVYEDTPTHCGFSDAEGAAGWEALRAWIGGAPQPDVDELQRQCETLTAGGMVEGPCRFDPDAEIVPFDAVVRPRAQPSPAVPGHSRHARPAPPGATAHASTSIREP
ncbi:MAG: hypothetical protein ACTHK2_14220 [Dokdonella sp.]|uniref:hypothetical protein n=1 Tax=Dokdonella sp. TaxID=2291710 RepID=UPI003F80DFE7